MEHQVDPCHELVEQAPVPDISLHDPHLARTDSAGQVFSSPPDEVV
jgi:hypothetical protein